jgi:hypothetical protein
MPTGFLRATVARVDEAVARWRPQTSGGTTMTKLSKKQQQELFLAEFLRRVREAPPGQRVYMRVGICLSRPMLSNWINGG